jgi:hypothetical protein
VRERERETERDRERERDRAIGPDSNVATEHGGRTAKDGHRQESPRRNAFDTRVTRTFGAGDDPRRLELVPSEWHGQCTIVRAVWRVCAGLARWPDGKDRVASVMRLHVRLVGGSPSALSPHESSRTREDRPHSLHHTIQAPPPPPPSCAGYSPRRHQQTHRVRPVVPRMRPIRFSNYFLLSSIVPCVQGLSLRRSLLEWPSSCEGTLPTLHQLKRGTRFQFPATVRPAWSPRHFTPRRTNHPTRFLTWLLTDLHVPHPTRTHTALRTFSPSLLLPPHNRRAG